MVFILEDMASSVTNNMTKFLSLEDQLDLITKGAAEIVPLEALKERISKSIASGVPMRIKAGFDPTAPDLHLGHTVLLQEAEAFSGPGAYGDFFDWGFYGADWGSDGTECDSEAADARRDCGECGDL